MKYVVRFGNFFGNVSANKGQFVSVWVRDSVCMHAKQVCENVLTVPNDIAQAITGTIFYISQPGFKKLL